MRKGNHMNNIQERYLLALSKKEFLDREIERRETDFLKCKNRSEKRLIEVEGDQEYDALTAEFFASLPPEYEPMYRQFSEQVAEAEQALIAYGLQIAPAGIRSLLAHGVKTAQIKSQFIQAVLSYRG